MAVAVVVAGSGDDATALVARVLVTAAVLHLGITALDLGGRHESRGAEVAASSILRGRYRPAFWWGAVAPTVAAIVVAGLAWNGDHGWTVLVAGLVVQPALLVYETVYVRAAQDVPLS